MMAPMGRILRTVEARLAGGGPVPAPLAVDEDTPTTGEGRKRPDQERVDAVDGSEFVDDRLRFEE